MIIIIIIIIIKKNPKKIHQDISSLCIPFDTYFFIYKQIQFVRWLDINLNILASPHGLNGLNFE